MSQKGGFRPSQGAFGMAGVDVKRTFQPARFRTIGADTVLAASTSQNRKVRFALPEFSLAPPAYWPE